MGEAFIVRRGGKATTFAVIGVTFPSGSTVSCAKGSVLLERMGSGTSAFFNVPKAGTWVVTITDGNKVKSQSVEITAAGQVEKIALDYGLTLFDNGTGKESWSTGVDPYAGGSASVGDTLHLFGDNGNATFGNPVGWVYTTQALSLAGKSTLSAVATTSFSGTMSHTGRAQVRVVEEAEAYSGSPAAASDLTEGTGKTTTLDISGLDASKKYRIVFMASGGFYDDQQGGVSRLSTTVDVTSVTAA